MHLTTYFMLVFVGCWIRGPGVDATGILFPSDSAKFKAFFRSKQELKRVPERTYIKKENPGCTSHSLYESICENDDEYDDDVKEKFREAFRKIDINDKIYKSILSKFMSSPIRTRIRGDVFSEPICPSQEHLVYPHRALTDSNEWVFVVNQDNITQGIIVEKCRNFRKYSRFQRKMDSFCTSFSNMGSRSSCKQRYIYRSMITMKKKGTGIAVRSVLIPSCCVCQRVKFFEGFGGDSSSHEVNEITSDEDRSRETDDDEEDFLHFGLNEI